MEELRKRRAQAAAQIDNLRSALPVADDLARGKACVYVTGSFGRREASSRSDLDLFIVGLDREDGGSQLNRLDEICIKADLIAATRKLNIPDFSGDGEYLRHYSVSSFTKSLGTALDDAENTFTARLLLLLESFPLLGEGVYKEVIDEVIGAYWRDYEDHKGNFIPAFLTNDILRLWRTFCVNYEARTKREPEERKAKGKLKNYKLKHSRLLTCYSALLYLLAVHILKKSVAPDDVQAMVTMTPTERLEWLIAQDTFQDARDLLVKTLDQYNKFLENTADEEHVILEKFMDRDKAQLFVGDANKFGDLIFSALETIGRKSKYYRVMVV